MKTTGGASGKDWSEIDTAFDHALDLDGEDRERYLASLPEGLRSAVDSLLRAVERPGPLDGGVDALAGRLLDEADARLDGELAGRRIGAYRIVERLGAGGMGVVYLAERADGAFEQRVALKVVRWEIAEPALVERFVTERRILAQLSHPHIATLLDGGMTGEGLPYLVLELVEGRPIDEHCEQSGLDLKARVALFEKVCRAIDFAHRQLVVHRDLKPSNILVRGDGVPKLLDFGVAKLLEDASADPHSRDIHSRLVPLTPRYAAPEQRSGGPVTTATDVWALGVVLYEILTGVHPFEDAAPGEPPREPVPPGRTSGDANLRGDLDNIVGTALRLAPEHRYRTAAELADDLERWRQGQVVRATPSTWTYRLGKLTRRHRAATAGFLAALAAAALGLGGILWQAHEARLERDLARAEAARAEHVTQFLEGLFAGASPRLQVEPSVRDLLDLGAERIRTELAEMPGVQARLLATLGSSYTGLGDHDRAEELFRAAIELERELGEERGEFVRALTNLGGVLHWSGRPAEAEAVFRDALERLRRLDERTVEEEAGLLHSLGMARTAQGDPEGALELFRKASELYGEENPGKIGMVRANMATALTRLERLAEAEAEHRAALAAFRRHNPTSVAIATVLNNLAINLDMQGRADEAMAVVEECRRLRANLPENHPDLAGTDSNVASFLIARGRPGDALAMARSAVRSLQGSAPSSPTWIAARANLGWALAQTGDHAEAETWLTAVVGDCETAYGEAHPVTARARTLYGELLRRQGRLTEAGQELGRAVAVLGDSRGSSSQRAQALVAWGAVQCDLGKAADGLRSVEAGAEILAAPPEDWREAEATIERARCLAALARPWDEEEARDAFRRLAEIRGPESWVVRRFEPLR